MEKVILDQKDAVDWVYRGEGAANLVLAYNGSSPVFTRVHVTKEFLLSVEKNVTCRRPACRIDSSQVDVNRDSVLIISDHSVFMNGTLKGGPCITVEIKISEYSEYNPLDLFSGSLDMICKAIEALYATPQNNFRVFLNGSIVFGGLGGGAGSTTVLVGEAFEDALKDVIKAGDGLCKTSFIQLVAETVYTSGVLGQLLEVQKLDAYDIEGAIHAYYNIISQPCMVCRELSKDKLSNRHTSLHSITLDESLKIVKDYLLAATVKDCSLMISFRPMEDGEVLSGSSNSTVYLGSTKQVFEYKVFFIDLDLKPLKKMEDYYKLDEKIANCYCQMAKTEHKADKAARRDAYEKVLT
ncbi:hypothetical protein V6N12_065181 [Hibiscus sabdariffa]|uniref:Inositol-pentakisphosphate 2-kinase n=1 Tax=Hibiscus sabdariffa TaxID=183260 RepID=A0ABR2G7X8_9ROSI